MEEYSYGFNELDLQIFKLVDKSLEENDFKYQAEIINELFNRKMLCGFEIIRAISIISSIVCNLENDIAYSSDGFPIDNCVVMKFSDTLDDMFADDFSNDEIFDFIKNELLVRERYELLNELKKYK
jgi:hypothetical protein